MSSSTALLPKDRKKHEHPIFLRICHSPWLTIHQDTLVGLRLAIALYLTVSFGLTVWFEVTRKQPAWAAIFKFSNISYFLQVLYQWIALVWTFTHLHYPQHNTSTAPGWIKLFVPPRQDSSTNNRYFFSLFYTVVTTFPHVASFVYWAVLVPAQKTKIPVGDLLGHDHWASFVLTNKYGINSLLAIVEVFVLSSIKRATPVLDYIFGLSFLALVYSAWAGVARLFTNEYPYSLFDQYDPSWEYVFGSIVIFVVVVNIFFGLVYVLTALREMLTKKGESSGYARLPQ